MSNDEAGDDYLFSIFGHKPKEAIPQETPEGPICTPELLTKALAPQKITRVPESIHSARSTTKEPFLGSEEDLSLFIKLYTRDGHKPFTLESLAKWIIKTKKLPKEMTVIFVTVQFAKLLKKGQVLPDIFGGLYRYNPHR